MPKTTLNNPREEWKPEDIINDQLEPEDYILTKDELEYMDYRFFKNYGHNYIPEYEGFRNTQKIDRILTQKLLRSYYKNAGMPIKEQRGYIGGQRWQKLDKKDS